MLKGICRSFRYRRLVNDIVSRGAKNWLRITPGWVPTDSYYDYYCIVIILVFLFLLIYYDYYSSSSVFYLLTILNVMIFVVVTEAVYEGNYWDSGEENGNSYFGVQGLGIWRFPKNRGTFFGVPQTKIIIF